MKVGGDSEKSEGLVEGIGKYEGLELVQPGKGNLNKDWL